jgi:hypothetical protein
VSSGRNAVYIVGIIIIKEVTHLKTLETKFPLGRNHVFFVTYCNFS